MKNSLFFAYLLTTLLHMVFFMPILVLPYLTKANGISDTTYGYFQTILMGLQIIGGPIFGNVIRIYGMKNSLKLCYLSNLLWALILWISQDFYGLLFSRIFGTFMNSIQVHQALITSLTNPGEERTKAFGKMGFTFGLNFLLSPIVAKILTSYFGQRSVLFCAMSLSAAAILINQFFIDEKDIEISDAKETKSNKSSLDATYQVLQRPYVFNAFAKKILILAPLWIIFINLQLYMIRKFDITVGGYGTVQASSGILLMIVNGAGIGWLRAKTTEPKLLLLGNVCVLFTMIQFFYFEHMWQIPLILPPLALGMSLVAAVADSIITSNVKPNEQGIILGFTSSVEVFCRTLAPALGGYILDNYSFSILGFIGLVSSSIALVGAFVTPLNEIEKHQDKKLAQNGFATEKKVE